MKKKYLISIFIAASLMVIFALSHKTWLNQCEKNNNAATVRVKQKTYVCSMHPQVTRSEPGDCPICGMSLIEKIEQDENSFDTTLKEIVLPVNESFQGSVRTITPALIALPLTVEASAIVNFNKAASQVISAHFGGYIERSFVKTRFQKVKKGQKIYEIYCPDIYADRWSYVKLLQAFPDRDDVTKEALEWLVGLGLSKGQIDSLKRAKIPDYHLAVYSRAEGYAVSKDFTSESLQEFAGSGFNDGLTVETGTPLFRLLDEKAIRIDLKVKIRDAGLLRKGQKVLLTDPLDAGKNFEALIDQVDPLNSSSFQTAKIYLKSDNISFQLTPGRQLAATIYAGSHTGLWVPSTAIAETGQHSMVFVEKDNRFIATEVRTGMHTGTKTEILSGIDENSALAEKAMLLIDSDGYICTGFRTGL